MQLPHPSSITVHPSGKVVVAGSDCKRIEVFNPDLTQSHLFGIHIDGDKTDDFRFPLVACDNDGIVYVAGRHCIRSYDIDGQCINKDFYNFTEGTRISGICIDSTNTLYVSEAGKVSVLRSSGKFIKNLDVNVEGEKEKIIAAITIDDTTGALYLCDYSNKRVICIN